MNILDEINNKCPFGKKKSSKELLEEDTKKNVEELDFEKLCSEKYTNVAIAKLVSLALKEFVENHK